LLARLAPPAWVVVASIGGGGVRLRVPGFRGLQCPADLEKEGGRGCWRTGDGRVSAGGRGEAAR
jgi:hypothetical protein